MVWLVIPLQLKKVLIIMNESLSLIYSAIVATKKAILDGDKPRAEMCGWELCNCFEENFVADKEEDYTPELCRLQLDALATLLDLHIMRGDPLDISARFGQLVKKFKMDVEHFPQWTDAEKKTLAEVVGRAIRHTQNFFIGQLTTTHKPLAEHPGHNVNASFVKRNRQTRKVLIWFHIF